MALQAIRVTGGLHRTLQQLEQGTLRIGFRGGSITDARPVRPLAKPTQHDSGG